MAAKKPAAARRGRPTKLNPETTSTIVTLIRAGNTVEVAADAAGINRATFFDWMDRGTRTAARDRPYREFREQVERARAEAETILVAQIQKAARAGSYRAASWLLERRFPERWATNGQAPEGEKPADPFEAFDELAHARQRRVAG